MSDKRKVRLMIYDTYGEFSGKPVGLDISKEEHDEMIEEASLELRQSYGFLHDNKGNGGNVLTGVRARSLTSLSDGTMLNDTNEDAKYKKMIYWARDVETENIPMVDSLALTTNLFMWGVANQGWTYNEPKELFGGEIQTHLPRKVRLGIPRVDTSVPDDQHKQFLKKSILMFTNEEDVVWDVKGNIPDLEEICLELNRECVVGELDKEEWDYNSDIVYGGEPYRLDLSDLSTVATTTTTAPVDEIAQGDCFEWLDTVADGSLDLLLTDPPYNVSAGTKAGAIFGNRGVNLNFGDWDFGFDTRKWINQVAPKVKDGGVAVIFNSFKNMELMARVLEEWDYTIVSMPYWCKTNPVPHLHDRVPLNGIESYLLAVRGDLDKVTVNIDGDKKEIYRPSRKDYVIHDRHYHSSHADQKKRFHTTQKPEFLFKELIGMFTQIGDSVADTFSGSGTTAVGCRDLGRHFYVVEQDDTYFAKSTDRLLKDTNSKKRVLI